MKRQLLNLRSGYDSHDRPTRGTQRQFCGKCLFEDDLRSRIFGTLVVKFLVYLPLHGFSNIQKMVLLPIFNGFLPLTGRLEFSGNFFLAEIFEKVTFDPYNSRITGLSAYF